MQISRSFYLIIAGPPINNEYFDYISKKVNSINDFLMILFYPRWISDSELELFIEASDVGVIPYVKTSTPASALLFMSFGKPVIVPDLPEVKDRLSLIKQEYNRAGIKARFISAITGEGVPDLMAEALKTLKQADAKVNPATMTVETYSWGNIKRPKGYNPQMNTE